MHFRSGAKCPLVVRLPCGGGLTFGSFHSQELESVFLAMPGFKALYLSGAGVAIRLEELVNAEKLGRALVVDALPEAAEAIVELAERGPAADRK